MDIRNREKLENRHCENLQRMYEIYSLLRDYYKNYKKKKMKDTEIGILLAKQISGKFYVKNKQFLENAFFTIQQIHKIRICEIPTDADATDHKMIVSIIQDHKKYIRRMIQLLNEIVYSKKVNKLKEEISIFGDKIIF